MTWNRYEWRGRKALDGSVFAKIFWRVNNAIIQIDWFAAESKLGYCVGMSIDSSAKCQIRHISKLPEILPFVWYALRTPPRAMPLCQVLVVFLPDSTFLVCGENPCLRILFGNIGLLLFSGILDSKFWR